ncbi:MAG: hypothetical protein VX245_07600 [Pseudomonadota bacterium]|nr:hypothetical protein [Pseudomonadota bacterium]
MSAGAQQEASSLETGVSDPQQLLTGAFGLAEQQPVLPPTGVFGESEQGST